MNVASVWLQRYAQTAAKVWRRQKDKSMAKWYGADDREAKRAKGTAKGADDFLIKKRLQGCKRRKRAAPHCCNRKNEHAPKYTLYTQ